MKVKVIVIDGLTTIQTVMAATKTIPIVSALIAGPDQFGIAKSRTARRQPNGPVGLHR